ncbi:MAG: metallopeptidase family protein, partial [Phycisphaerales bacterium]|nr:metallopeptidase family protein [Phycisphaerales bacterium]
RAERDRFDVLLQDVLDALPPGIMKLIERVPLVVEDRPDAKLVKQLVAEGTLESEAAAAELCGLHTGVPITDRSIEDPDGWGVLGADGSGPETVHLFREGIVALAGGWEAEHADENVYEEIRITVLHEIGHHYGLDEDDLDELGYA